ncbi:hypothetical protein [Winogradskyella eximia]|jgi:hypothetical protein|uniref:hypothetical protein n=1 Tax=Winogradskyella eximia TaxID=262006 RepID=UPI0024932D65|nr:hypothetical protein [Winogradskyella eximia]
MAKQKIINEDVSINFRIPPDLKREIIRQAENQNITISNYLRSLLADVHSGKHCEEIDERNEADRFVYSKEFISLIIWIYSKSRNQTMVEKDNIQLIDNFIRIIKRADSYLPTILILELDKVLIDLYRIKALESYQSKEFKFTNTYNKTNDFNFTVLENFLLNYP